MPFSLKTEIGQPIRQHWRQRWPWLLLLAVSALLHLWRLAEPAEVAFDESLVGRFASYYFSGEYYFDIHPPHMKLIYAALGALAGVPQGFSFHPHGLHYPGGFYLWMRLFPALCGTVLPLLVARLALDFGAARRWALCAGWLAAFDTVLMVESRFILNDIPLLTFGLAGWCGMAAWRRQGKKRHLLLGALALGLACGVKWTGLGFAAPVLAALALEGFPAIGPIWQNIRRQWRAKTGAFLAIVAVILLVQGVGYALHFALLPKAGPGDAYMSAPMQQRLKERRENPAGSDWLFTPYATLELHRAMASYSSQVSGHPYASPWYTWPWGWRGIFVWSSQNQPPERIYMAANIAIWWPLALGALYFLAALLPSPWRGANMGKPAAPPAQSDYLLALAYLVNFAPFFFIHRPMFIYHYFPALAVSYVMSARLATCAGLSRRWAWFFAAAGLLGFLWLAPVVYGLPIQASTFNALMLFDSWK